MGPHLGCEGVVSDCGVRWNVCASNGISTKVEIRCSKAEAIFAPAKSKPTIAAETFIIYFSRGPC